MKMIELVTHCWAMELPQYATFLAYKLSSLILHPPKCEVTVTICCDEYADDRTHQVIEFFSKQDLILQTVPLDINKLGRRAIGRNIAAKHSIADIVWFDDVDQVYRDGVLDRLAEMEWPEGASMIYPNEVMIHRDHALGDAAVQDYQAHWPCVMDVFPRDFIPKRYGKAIGGVQIIQGDFAREHGYLDGDEKWQQPTDGRFDACRCDVPYRKFCKSRGEVVEVDLHGMYRLRHTAAGHGREASKVGGV